MSKKSTCDSNFYLPILNALEHSTNLSNIQSKLSISKQQLNYYIRKLKQFGFLIQKGRGWYEVVKDSKNLTKYDNFLKPDFTRGHAYIWTIKLPLSIEGWDNRITKLKEKGIHYVLVGAKENTPRIKLLGRKIWLCNDSIRIYDKKGNSYYGQNAIEVRNYVLSEVSLIVNALINYLGVSISTLDIEFNKEHYALIKNDLAIEHNKKGEQLHIFDNQGEWLLIDDSLGEGGELETIGKKAFRTNIPMQKWWNNQKETDFKVTPDFILNTMNGIQQNQLIFAENMKSHIKAVQDLGKAVNELREQIKHGNKN